METANIVVQRVDTENDIGRDAFVDIVDGTDVTGAVVCFQVKSGKSFFYRGKWLLPGDPADFRLWRESTVPFFGAVHNPDDDSLRWVDLSHAARLAHSAYLSPVIPGPYGKPSVPVPDNNRLDVDLTRFLDTARNSLRRSTGLPVAALLAEDPPTVQIGIDDTFAMGRHDPNAFLLLAALFHRLPKSCRNQAVLALAMTTPHPDVFWTRSNWVPTQVSATIRERCHWTAPDIAALLDEIGEDGIERGSFGQSVYHVLALDRDLRLKLFKAALDRDLPSVSRFWATAILLYLAGESAPGVLDDLLESDRRRDDQGLFPVSHPLVEVQNIEHLVNLVVEFGYVSLF